MFQEMLKVLSKRGKRDLILSSLFFALYGLSSVYMIVLIFSILFLIAGGESIESIYPKFIYIVLLVIFKGVCNVVADLKKHGAGFDIVQQIRERMIIKLKQFSLGFYSKERLGEINTILHKDVDNMSLVVGHMWSRMFGDFLVAIFVFGYLAIFDISLAFIMLSFVLISLVFLYHSIRKSKCVESQNNSALVDMVSLFVEYVRAIPVLKSFSNNTSMDERLMRKVQAFGASSKKSSRLKAKQLSIFGFLLDLGYLLLIVISGIFTFNGYIDIFYFMVFAVISKEFYKPFASMEMHYMYYISASDSYERLGKILYAEGILDKKSGKIPMNNDIYFDNIGFSYEEDEFCIKDLCFEVKEKTMTAFVGESGSGKTTITKLLLRFYDVQEGSIKLGEIDIRDIPYDELLNRISIVMQDVQLFDDSIEENVRVGKKGASREEIIEACKKARLHEFIMSLPEGYETQIGENGGVLSGGQRQRLSIARAFLKDSPILILDEMTSNVDPVNESLIQDAISCLAKDRTVLVIAHHLKSIREADQILVFKKGKLLERGNHGELLKKQGYYAKLWGAECR